MGILGAIEKLSAYQFDDGSAILLDRVRLTRFQNQDKKLYVVEPGSAPDPNTVAVIQTITSGFGSNTVEYTPLTVRDLKNIVALAEKILRQQGG